MYNVLQSAHSIFAYIALLVLVVAIGNAITGVTSKKTFETKDFRISLFGIIVMHLQLLIGFILYFVSPLGLDSLGQMKNSDLRLTSLEHPLIGIVAITVITIGWSKHKKQESSNAKFKKIAIFYTIGLVLILSRLPWKNWFI